jgi:limonene-1,2-epoxide hydrolase
MEGSTIQGRLRAREMATLHDDLVRIERQIARMAADVADIRTELLDHRARLESIERRLDLRHGPA